GNSMGASVLLQLNESEEAVGFANWPKAAAVSKRGTVTPDHVIHVKPLPMMIAGENPTEKFASDYHAYFARHNKDGLKELDACARWAVWPEVGILSIAANPKALRVVNDITKHTIRCLQWSEQLGGFKPVSESDLFDVEYWELEQAKLKVGALKSA